MMAVPFSAHQSVLALLFGASKDHTSITSWCHQTRALWSLCRPTVPFSLFPMAQHTPPDVSLDVSHSTQGGQRPDPAPGWVLSTPLGMGRGCSCQGIPPSPAASPRCVGSATCGSALAKRQSKAPGQKSPQGKATHCPHILSHPPIHSPGLWQSQAELGGSRVFPAFRLSSCSPHSHSLNPSSCCWYCSPQQCWVPWDEQWDVGGQWEEGCWEWKMVRGSKGKGEMGG